MRTNLLFFLLILWFVLQRWKYIRKHHHQDLNVGGNSSNKLSEAQLATRHAMSLALNMPSITANTIGTGDSLLLPCCSLVDKKVDIILMLLQQGPRGQWILKSSL